VSEYLIVQGIVVDPLALESLAHLGQAHAITRLSATACRLEGAQRVPGLAEAAAGAGLDLGWVPAERRLGDFKLFITDMDSTLITIECIDEIADLAGVKPQVAAITAAAMRGEIDFSESLRRRVALLAGLEASALERVFAERLNLNPGATELLSRLNAEGITTVLVSGGFTFFTERLRKSLGFDHAVANELEIADGRLTGRVIGEIVDAAKKRRTLEEVRSAIGATVDETIAVGDGANDLKMFGAAGLSFAYHAKPVVRAAADYALDHSGLAAILPLLGA
jgi:phosphoserine phosphatase